jgi:hypothetical protein
MMASEISDEFRMDVADNRDMIVSIRERLAAVESALKMLTTLFAGDGKSLKTVEASETETVRKRKVKVRE